jgi:hypothetical protein
VSQKRSFVRHNLAWHWEVMEQYVGLDVHEEGPRKNLAPAGRALAGKEEIMGAYRSLRRTGPVTAVAALAIAVTKTALILLHLLIASLLLLPVSAAEADSLYIGDGDDNSVKRFDVATGAYQGIFVVPDSGGLDGPRGLIFTRGRISTPIRLYVVNQNVDKGFGGEILRYRRSDGQFVDAPVPCNPPLRRGCDPNAPFAPRGLIRGLLPTVYVADLGDFHAHQGAVKQFEAETGDFIGDLDSTGFPAPFFPRGLVFGPDRLLYVSVVGNLAPPAQDVLPVMFCVSTQTRDDLWMFSPVTILAGAPGGSTGPRAWPLAPMASSMSPASATIPS